jgi:hypothetical protein
MEHSTMRKLVRAATLSVLVLTTTSGVAGLVVMAGSIQGLGLDQPDPPTPTPIPTPTPTPTPVPPLPVP